MYESIIRLRMSSSDVNYGRNLVDGSRILTVFGDLVTELLIKCDDGGVFKAYEHIEFVAPVYVGAYIKVCGKIISIENTSRKMIFEARKVVSPRPDINDSASFTQIERVQNGDVEKIKDSIMEMMDKGGNMRNPVTGAGGMLIGTVEKIGENLFSKINLN